MEDDWIGPPGAPADVLLAPFIERVLKIPGADLLEMNAPTPM